MKHMNVVEDTTDTAADVLFDGDHLTSNIGKMKEKIMSLLGQQLSDIEGPSFLYVCGRPGTGKVSSLFMNHILSYLSCSVTCSN